MFEKPTQETSSEAQDDSMPNGNVLLPEQNPALEICEEDQPLASYDNDEPVHKPLTKADIVEAKQRITNPHGFKEIT